MKYKYNKKCQCISTYDFGTLLKLPHNKLLDILFQQMDFVFKCGNKSFIKISTKGKPLGEKS